MTTLLHKWSSKYSKTNNVANKSSSPKSLLPRTPSSSSSFPRYPWSQRKLRNSQRTLPRHGHASISHAKHGLLVYGGRHKGHIKKELFAIDTVTMTTSIISTVGDLPSQRIYPAMASFGNFVVLYGGESLSTNQPWDLGLYILSLDTRTWVRTRIYHEIGERSGHSMVAIQNKFYIWGGKRSSNVYMNDLCVFQLRNGKYGDWERIVFPPESSPPPRSNHCSVIVDSTIFIFGGGDKDKLFNDVWLYDINLRKWACLETTGFVPSPRHFCAVALIDGIVYVHGGKDEKGKDLHDLYGFKLKNRCWYMFQNMGRAPSPRSGHTMTTVGSKIFVVGGDHTNSVAKLDDPLTIYVLDNDKVTYPPEELEHLAASNQRRNSSPILPPSDRSLSMNIITSESTPISSATLVHSPRKTPSRSSSLQAGPLVSPTASSQSHTSSAKSTTASPTAAHTFPSNCIDPVIGVIGSQVEKARPISTAETIDSAGWMDHAHTTSNISMTSTVSTLEQQLLDERQDSMDERSFLLQQIKARDLMINEMKNKEHWWRTQVAKARGIDKQPMGITTPDQQINLLSFSNDSDNNEDTLHENGEKQDQEARDRAHPTKQLIFEQLVMAKSEARHIKRDIQATCQPICVKLDHEERLRQAALTEADHYRSLCAALLLRRRKSAAGLMTMESDTEDENDRQNLSLNLEVNGGTTDGVTLYQTLQDRRAKRLQQELEKVLHDNLSTEKALIEIQRQAAVNEQARQIANEQLENQHLRAHRSQAAYDTVLKRLYLLQKRTIKDDRKYRVNQHHINLLYQQLDMANLQLKQQQSLTLDRRMMRMSREMGIHIFEGSEDNGQANNDKSKEVDNTQLASTSTISVCSNVQDIERHWQLKNNEQANLIASLQRQLADATQLIRNLHLQLKKSTHEWSTIVKKLEVTKAEIEKLTIL